LKNRRKLISKKFFLSTLKTCCPWFNRLLSHKEK